MEDLIKLKIEETQKELERLKLLLPAVVWRSEQLAVSHTFEANDNFSGLCKHCKKGKLFHG